MTLKGSLTLIDPLLSSMRSRSITKNQSREMEAKIGRAYHAKIFIVHFLSHLKTGENVDFSVFLHLILFSKYLPIAISIVCEYSLPALAYIHKHACAWVLAFSYHLLIYFRLLSSGNQVVLSFPISALLFLFIYLFLLLDAYLFYFSFFF